MGHILLGGTCSGGGTPRDPYSCGKGHWPISEVTCNADREEGNRKRITSHLMGERIIPLD